jgi:hypothetical protein
MFLTLAAVGFTQTAPPSTGSCTGQTATFKSIRLSRAVLANGVPLPAGVYDVRITTDRPAPAVGQSAAGECWVEFLKDGAVAGREVASVIGPDAIATVAKGSVPKPNTARVDELKQSEHLRVWINSDGTHFLINLPIAPELEPRPVLQPAAADAAAVR